MHLKRAGQLLALSGIVSTTLLVGAGTTIPAAHADVKHVTHVFDIPSNNDPRPNRIQMQVPMNGGPGCDHVPGLVREGHFYSNSYVFGENADLHIELETHYVPAVATAAATYKELAGQQIPCNLANSFDQTAVTDAAKNGVVYDDVSGPGDFDALRTIACSPWSSKVSSRFCQLALRPLQTPALQMPSQINLHLDRCANQFVAYDKGGNVLGDSRDVGFAEWDNLQAYVMKDKSHFLPFDVYVNSINQRLGVGPSESDGTTDLTKPIEYYGKVQTWSSSEWWVDFYDQVARALGKDPVANPIAAYNAVDTAASNGKSATFKDVFGVSATRKIAQYEQDLRKFTCLAAPWVGQALGDSSPADYATPYTQNASGAITGGGIPASAPTFELVVGSCDTGLTAKRVNSSAAVVSYLQDFIRHENGGVVPDELQGFNGIGIPWTIQSAWQKTGPLTIYAPGTSSTGQPTCTASLALGNGRQNHGYNLATNIKGLF